MSSKIDTFKGKGGWTVELHADEDSSASSPRQWDNLSTIVSWDSRSAWGDDGSRQRADWIEQFDSWKEVEEWCGDGEPVLLIPLYFSDHGGSCALDTTAVRADDSPYNSHCNGFAFIKYSKIAAEYGPPENIRRGQARTLGYPYVDPEWIEKARKGIECEIEEYSKWLTGDVYGYIVKDARGREVDDGSCWGLIGMEYAEQEARGALNVAYEAHMQERRERAKQARIRQRDVNRLVNLHYAL